MTIDWAFRTMIVPAGQVELARTLAATLTGEAGAGMWETAVSATGEAPATHFISTGMIDADFAALLPLTTVGEAGAATAPGAPDVLAALASQAGLSVTAAQVAAVLDAADVTELEPFTALDIAGLRIVQEDAAPV